MQDDEKKNWVFVPLEELITSSSYLQCVNSDLITSWLFREPQKSKCFFFLENDQTSFAEHQTHLELDFMAEQVDHAYSEVETITDAWRIAEEDWEHQTCSLKDELHLQSESLKNSQQCNEILNQTVKELERKIVKYTKDIVQYQNGALEASKLKKKLKGIITALQKKNYFLETNLKNYDFSNRSDNESPYQKLPETKQLQIGHVDSGTRSLSHGIYSALHEPSQTFEVRHTSINSSTPLNQINSPPFEKDRSDKNETRIGLHDLHVMKQKGVHSDFLFFRSCPNCKSFCEHLQTESKKLKGFIKEQQEKYKTLSIQYSKLVELLEHHGLNPTKCLVSMDDNKKVASFNLVPLDKFRKIAAQLKLETRLYQLMKHQCGLAIARELRRTLISPTNKNKFQNESQVSASTQTENYLSFSESKTSSMCFKQKRKGALCTVVQSVAISLNKERLGKSCIKPPSNHSSLPMIIKETPEHLHQGRRVSLPLLDSFDGFATRKLSAGRSNLSSKIKPLIPVNVKPSRTTFLPPPYNYKEKIINTSSMQPIGFPEHSHTLYSPPSSTQNLLAKTWKSSMSTLITPSLDKRENKSMSSSQCSDNKMIKPLLGDSTTTYPKLYKKVSSSNLCNSTSNFDDQCKMVWKPTLSYHMVSKNKESHQVKRSSQPMKQSTLQMRESLPSLNLQNFFNKAKSMIKSSNSFERVNQNNISVTSASRRIENDTGFLTLMSTCSEHSNTIKNRRSLSSDINMKEKVYPNYFTSYLKSTSQARMTQSYPAAHHTGSKQSIVCPDLSQRYRNVSHATAQPSHYTSFQTDSGELNLSNSKYTTPTFCKNGSAYHSLGTNLENKPQVYSDLSLTPIYSRNVLKNASMPSEGFISYALNSLNIPGGTLSSTSTMSHSLSENLLNRSRFNSLTL